MLRLLEQIFHGEGASASGYPDDLVQRATERALEATDPRVRIVPSYARKMRPSVVHAIDHIMKLVDTLAAPIPMSPADWASQVVMGAMFASGERLQDLVRQAPASRDFMAANASILAPVTALLLANPVQRHVFAPDLVGDKVVNDVPLTVVSFDGHTLVGLAATAEETRRFLKWRAFDHVLMLALEKITQVQDQRTDLVARRKVLQAKCGLLARSSGSLLDAPRLAEQQEFQQKLDQVERQLQEMGADDGVLQQHLDIIIETLAAAEKQLWRDDRVLYLDDMNYLRPADHPKAKAIPLQVLQDAHGHEKAARLVVIPPSCFAQG